MRREVVLRQEFRNSMNQVYVTIWDGNVIRQAA